MADIHSPAEEKAMHEEYERAIKQIRSERKPAPFIPKAEMWVNLYVPFGTPVADSTIYPNKDAACDAAYGDRWIGAYKLVK